MGVFALIYMCHKKLKTISLSNIAAKQLNMPQVIPFSDSNIDNVEKYGTMAYVVKEEITTNVTGDFPDYVTYLLCTFQNMKWLNAHRTNLVFNGCHFENVTFYQAHFDNCFFTNCLFKNCKVIKLTMHCTIMTGCLYEDMKKLM